MAYSPYPSGSGNTTRPEERTWAAVAHIGALVAAWFALGVLGPLTVLVLKGNDSAFVRRHAVESLNFQISLFIYGVIAALLAIFTLGVALIIEIPLAAIAIVLALVVIIQATLAANRGEDYRYPLCIRLVH